MSDIKKIGELASKINNLLEAVKKNNGQFTALDKDLATNYIRDLYESILAVQPTMIAAHHTENEDKVIIEKVKEEKPVEIKDETKPIFEKEIMPVITEVKREIIPVPEVVAPLVNVVEEKKKENDEKVSAEKTKKTVAGSGSKKSISEIYAGKMEGSKVTLNEKYNSGSKMIADKLKQTPIKDLKAYIGLNKRFSFINSLFKGNEKSYEEAIAKVNSFTNYEEAITYIRDHLLASNDWNDDEPMVAEFFNLVMRRYLN